MSTARPCASSKRVARRVPAVGKEGRQSSAGVASGAGLGSIYFGYGRSVGDPLRVGVLGTGDEGSVLIGAHTPDYLNVIAIADIRPFNVHRAFHGDVSTRRGCGQSPGQRFHR